MKRKCLFLFLCGSVLMMAFWLGVWTAWAEGYAHYTPEYAKVDIVPILQKRTLERTDYEELFLQTGMTQVGVDELRGRNRQSDLLLLQERFFAEAEMVCLRDFYVVQSERLVQLGEGSLGYETSVVNKREIPLMAEEEKLMESHFLPAVHPGDILISFNGHIFGWRNGHAAIVVDAEEGLTLEAITLGSDSRICSIEKWAEYPCFALLRLEGAPLEERMKIAEYAKENLVGVSYRLLSFSGEGMVADATALREQKRVRKTTVAAEEALAGTHCAHLVWSAYAHFGYNLDSDGGLIVTPRDIFDSDLLEVVQIYGLSPEAVLVE